MRIWDVHPGYLNRQSLLAEHRELHAVVSIIVNRKHGYSRHPETMRWRAYGWALRQRHELLACEMALRGYTEKTPVATGAKRGEWPSTYLDDPVRQYRLLEQKYRGRESGRIPLPRTAQVLWSQHKYSVLARDPQAYIQIGREVAAMKRGLAELAGQLVELLRRPPTHGGIRNAVQHMWGYVSKEPPQLEGRIESLPLARLLRETQQRAVASNSPHLTGSTALSELMAWLGDWEAAGS